MQEYTSYHKISDGNAADKGIPGYRTEKDKDYTAKITNSNLIKVWDLAISLCNKYNGKDGRHMTKTVLNGGFDFSDMPEVIRILNVGNANNVGQFFEIFGK